MCRHMMNLEVDNVPLAEDWVFIAGPTKTGTTALRWLISEHPDAYIVHEGWILGYANMMSNRLVSDGVPGSTSICTDTILGAIRGSAHQRCAVPDGQNTWKASELRELMEHLREWISPSVSYFGDKKGAYARYCDFTRAIFPGCRIVTTTRDPWDAAADMVTIMGVSAKKAVVYANRWQERCLGIEGAHNVVFENMASDPEKELVELFDYIGLAPTCYDFSAINQTHYPQSIGRWRQVPELVELRERLGNPLC